MGRKKPTPRDDDAPPPPAAGKSKKKALVIDDDEYSVATDLSEEPQVQEDRLPNLNKKKGKKGGKGRNEDDDDDQIDRSLGEVGDDDDVGPAITFAGKKKSTLKKGRGGNAFSTASFSMLDDEGDGAEDELGTSAVTGDQDSDGEEEEEEEEPVISFTGKKMPAKKGGKGGRVSSAAAASAFDALNEEDGNDGEIEDEVEKVDRGGEDDGISEVAFIGKKKPSKSKKKGGGAFTVSGFGALDDDDDDEAELEKKVEDDEEDVAAITFSGKKKKSSKSSKKGGNSFGAALVDEAEVENPSVSEVAENDENNAEDDDVIALSFAGKKKSSKKKSTFTNVVDETNLDGEIANSVKSESTGGLGNGLEVIEKNEDKVETTKNKKKKKKTGRTAQEEDDLDKILAELGEGPSIPRTVEAAPQDDESTSNVEVVAPTESVDDKEGDDENLESAAAKKKKKKKEKEKEKKAAAAAAAAGVAEDLKEDKQEDSKIESAAPKKNDAKAKAAEKKIPKHVREMQEALARRKEAEERKQKEEEEKRRREEEERRKQEEHERQLEEAKRKKKEKEKEKLQKKRQEGRLLTGRQKEEARRREAMRNQILANAAFSLPTGEAGTAPGKRPKYNTKKSRPTHSQANGGNSLKESQELEHNEEAEETVEADVMETSNLEEENLVEEPVGTTTDAPVENELEENDEEDDEEWDAKSWDDVNITVKSSFAEEEDDSNPEPVLKKVTKVPVQASGATVPSAAANSALASTKIKAPELARPQRSDTKKAMPAAEAAPKNERAGPTEEVAGPDNGSTANDENLRSPICCIMGHVDTGKTKLLDCIRGTNVQEGEAGGITQQIGATYFPAENIRERTKELKADAKLKVPGLLVIDTPGHESFTNLRSRGSGLCDIAILVVDIMHGLEPQTIESLNLLKMRNTEFIVALNKVDRLYGWKTCKNAPIRVALKQQTKDVQNEFEMRFRQIRTQFQEQALNTELYYKNREMGETFSVVPTSAISGEGIPDMLLLLIQWTQRTMVEKLTFRDEIQCTVLEVKVVEGHGTTIDVVLVNGVLHEGDQIVVCGLQGPIVTTIRALLTPHPMKELRVKGTYLHHKEIKAAQGIKITAQGLEHAIAGTGLYVVGPDDDVEQVKDLTMEDMRSVMSRIDRTGEGVCVQASTLGSLEALLEFLKTPEVSIPVSGISIGPVHKKDVMKASVMLEKKKEYATILAFDVKVTPEARDLAEELGVKIFMADIIYHLFDQFKAYIDNIKEEKKKEAAEEAVFPCVLQILPNCVFNKKDPIVLGVDILEGIAKVGTPICIPQRDFIDIGRIASIENNHKPVDTAKKGQKVAIKIVGSNPEEQQKMFGRHFDLEDELVSHISRKSIDILKLNYRDDLSIEEWKLVVKLKNLFKIQ
ncbi:hypothetical protein MLD38_001476 [Melastoma candidum]|uniref:Uncharacterized protein n=1 Tax=Melastoma candidum TaxID=119954 RepID=A0ACB9SEZ7_9MYRT|nr:hypothetical protein MLD38_001476 [Melastoma candidum]